MKDRQQKKNLVQLGEKLSATLYYKKLEAGRPNKNPFLIRSICNIRVPLIILSIIFASNLVAQNDSLPQIKVIGRALKDKVLLRWAPTTPLMVQVYYEASMVQVCP
jgi:hypothetical protein